MSEDERARGRVATARPIGDTDDAARTEAEAARTQALIRASATHARLQRTGGRWSQADLTSLVEAIERDLWTAPARGRRVPCPVVVERRRPGIAQKP